MTRRFILKRDGSINSLECAYCHTSLPMKADVTGQLRCPKCASSPLAAHLLMLADRVEARIKTWFGMDNN